MDTTADRPDSLTPGTSSGTALATPPRRRKATRPTGPPEESESRPETAEPESPDEDPAVTPDPVRPGDAPRRRRLPRPRLKRITLGRRSIRIALVALATVALVAAAAVATPAWQQHRHANSGAQQRAAIVDTARRGITALINISGDKADADFAHLSELTTAPFSNELHSRSANYVKAIHDADVLSTGQVVAAGIATDDGTAQGGDGTTVLVAADAQVTNTQSHQQEHRSYRFSVKVKKIDGAFKVSDVEFVP